VRLLPCGSAAVLVELDSGDEVARIQAGLEAGLPAGVEEIVPGARTVLVRFDRHVTDAQRLGEALRAVRPRDPGTTESPLVEIAVVYDGEDLEEVAGLTGLRVEEVVARHQSSSYRVAFCGFAPGFAYLTGLPAELHVPRRETPRVTVPAGAVAIAGEHAAVYPRSSPGGWRLLGRTDAVLWDLGREQPALLRPGTRVRFVS
jgi:KipI family sensor histidine kinase inhibitor